MREPPREIHLVALAVGEEFQDGVDRGRVFAAIEGALPRGWRRSKLGFVAAPGPPRGLGEQLGRLTPADDRWFGIRSQHEARVVARERDIGQPQLVDRSVGHAFHGPAEVVREEAGPES